MGSLLTLARSEKDGSVFVLHPSAVREKGPLGVGKDCALGRVRALRRDAIDESSGK